MKGRRSKSWRKRETWFWGIWRLRRKSLRHLMIDWAKKRRRFKVFRKRFMRETILSATYRRLLLIFKKIRKCMVRKQPVLLPSTSTHSSRSNSKATWFQNTRRKTSRPKTDWSNSNNYTSQSDQPETLSARPSPKPKTRSPRQNEDTKSSTIKLIN